MLIEPIQNQQPEENITPNIPKKKWSLDPKTRKIVLIGALCALGLVLIYVVVIRYFWSKNNNNNVSVLNKIGIAKKEEAPSLVDGVKMDKNNIKRTPVAVVIENHPDARPQSGLAYADVVYEALAEGGITRFLAVYQSNFPEKVGPVRSARTYFIDWVSEYNAFFAHYGGNIDALAKIKTDKIQDLDEFSNAGSKAYWRENDKNISSEHTAYASVSKLYDLGVSKNYTRDFLPTFVSWVFKNELALEDRPATQKVEINFSSSSYKVGWVYDKASNSYTREMGGSPHIDKTTNQQIKAKTILIQEAPAKPIITEINEQGLEMQTVGKGKAKVVLDGKIIEGTWQKASRADRTNFYDTTGNKIEFNPGQIWVEVVPPGTGVIAS